MKTENKTPTLEEFIASTNIPDTLIHAVVNQMGAWNEFRESAPDIVSHGASYGVNGFIYYHETDKFVRSNRIDILAVLNRLADDLGESETQLVKEFDCIQEMGIPDCVIGAVLLTSKDLTPEPYEDAALTVRNALAWFALEEVARAYMDQ